ncbi:MAG: DsrE family protein [Nitrospinota bacterium]|nr:DsrE family protein [Nitrospinota bacterium]MDH5679357.1 DsrE family protein [Nitrospinota bacterium]MDH5755865.1 DsrE family protein [Nitrospinota bacterium]
MKILLLLHRGFSSPMAESAVKIAKAAVAAGHEAQLFVMADGVTLLAREDFAMLTSHGVAVTVCDHNRAQLKAPEKVEGVKYGSQYDLAGYIQDFDRTISFT